MASSTPTVSPVPARYCRKCGYDLRATSAGSATPAAPSTPARCPECGRVFDTANAKTFRQRPFAKPWVRWVRRAAYSLLTLVLLLAAVWGWFYWGWASEQRALAELRPSAKGFMTLSPWLQKHLGSAGFVLDRVVVIFYINRKDVKDISAMSRFSELRLLGLVDTDVHDISPLARLRHLEQLSVPAETISDADVAALQRALPRCKIERIPQTVSPLFGRPRGFDMSPERVPFPSLNPPPSTNTGTP